MFPSRSGTARLSALLLVTLLLSSVPALASPLELLGGDVRSAGLAGGGGAHGYGAGALFHNVASLTRSSPALEFGFSVVQDNSRILLQARPNGYDIPDLDTANTTIPTERTLMPRSDTPEGGSMTLMTLGAVTHLNQERLRLAVLATLPVTGGSGQTTWFVDERERLFSNRLRYELLGDRVRRFDVHLGAAYEVIDNVSIGIGVQFLPSVQTNNDVYLPDVTEQGEIDLALQATQGATWGLHAGLLVQLSERLSVGLAWRDAIRLQLDGKNTLRIRGFDDDPDTYPVVQEFSTVPFYSPAMITLSAAWQVGRSTLTADFRQIQWSGYLDRNAERTGFNDVLSPGLGFEYRYSENTRVRGGWTWVPSPVPAQTGRTNYVDNSRLILALGASHDLEVRGYDLEISWFGQLHVLEPRTTTKFIESPPPVCGPGVTALCDEVPDDLRDPRTGAPIAGAAGLQTGNPGFPGFTSGGWIAAIGVQVRHAF